MLGKRSRDEEEKIEKRVKRSISNWIGEAHGV